MLNSPNVFFGVKEIEYLGHTISGKVVHMEKSKIQAIKDWYPPTNIKQLRGFLGLTCYYHRFIKNYASLAAPVTDLLKKDNFVWTKATNKAFMQLKSAITFEPVLALPNFDLPFELETDASSSVVLVLSSPKGTIQ